MYVYRPELKAQGRFPIEHIHVEGDAKKADAQAASNEDIEQEQQNPDVRPKNNPDTPTSQVFEEAGILKNDTQKDSVILNEGDVDVKQLEVVTGEKSNTYIPGGCYLTPRKKFPQRCG